MLKRLGRRFYSAKYVFSIHLHSVSPWFMHERPAKVSWKRGAKKHKKGATAPRMPVHSAGTHMNLGKLEVEEAFELGVTLYAESNKTKKTGPYGVKDLKLVIMEIDDDGDIYSILGALTINLNEYTGLVDHKIKVPVECDAEIVEAVGQPYFDITIRSWYKQNLGGTSKSSGLSSTGWTAQGSDSEEEVNELASTGDSHFEPVKPVESLDSTRAVSTFAMDSVPEQIELDNSMTQDQRNAVDEVKTGGVDQTNQENSSPEETEELPREEAVLLENADAALIAIETKKNNIQDEDDDDDKEEAPEVVTAAQVSEEGKGVPSEAGLITVGVRYTRLSTIDSEAGEEAMALLAEENEDELKKFLASELKDDELDLEPVPSFSDEMTREGMAVGKETIKQESYPLTSEMAVAISTPEKEAVIAPQDSQTRDVSTKAAAADAIVANQTNTEPEVEEISVPVTATDVAAAVLVPAASASAETEKERHTTPVTAETEEEEKVAALTTPVKTETAAVEVATPVEPLPVLSADATVNKADEVGTRVAEPTGTKPTNTVRFAQPPHSRQPVVRRRFWFCLPGSNLVCCQCQPALPREA